MKSLRVLFSFMPMLIFMFSSCFTNNCKRVELSKEDKKWLNPYRIGQKIIFKSDKSTDTLVVVSKSNSYTPCNKFELGEYQYNEAGFYLTSSKCHNTSYCTISLGLTGSKRKNCDKYFQVFDLWSQKVSDLDSIIVETIILKPSNKKYTTYHFEINKFSRDIDAGETGISSFHWSKKDGLMRYTTGNYEVFDFWKKI